MPPPGASWLLASRENKSLRELLRVASSDAIASFASEVQKR
jgi:hypothetical protein